MREPGIQTILIDIFDRGTVRNILRENFLDVIRARRVRLVLLVHEGRREEIERQFMGEDIIVDVRPNILGTPMENAALFVARNSIPTHTVRQIQEEGLDGSGRLRLDKYLLARVLHFLGQSHLYQSFLKFFLPLFFRGSLYADILARHRPDLVFIPTVYTVTDLRLLKEARRRRISTVGMIKSWDNLTSKDGLLIPPDHLIVHNEIVRDEAVTMHRFPVHKIFVSGVPQFDDYADPSIIPREGFLRSLGLDPQKKTILYSAMGTWLVMHEESMITFLARMVREGVVGRDVQLLVRLHPAYPGDLERLTRLGIVVDRPGGSNPHSTAFKAEWKFGREEVRHLMSTLRWSDVVINSGSTMILDAVCFDRPLIGAAFDGEVDESSYWQSARRLFEREHCKKVVATGGVRIAHSREEMAEEIKQYLADPARDYAARARLLREQCVAIDGESGRRIASFVLACVPYEASEVK